MSGETERRRRALALLMLGVSVWGSLLALGAFLFGYDAASGQVAFSPSWLRGGIVLACVLTFLGVWTLLVRRRFK